MSLKALRLSRKRVNLTLMDRRWQLVLHCLDTDQALFGKGTFVAFRKRLIEARMDRRLIERTIELANSTQEFGPRALRAALDSNPLWGAGRVEDTFNLIGHALKKALRLVAKHRGETVADVGQEAGAEMVCGSTVLDRDWDQVGQREEALELVVQVLQAVESWVLQNLACAREQTLLKAGIYPGLGSADHSLSSRTGNALCARWSGAFFPRHVCPVSFESAMYDKRKRSQRQYPS